MPDKVPFEDRSSGFGPTESEKERKSFYNSRPWKELRLRQLRLEPLCRRCLAEGKVVEATTVHHVEERLDRPDLKMALANLESLCGPHHTKHHTTRRRMGNAP